MKYCNNCQRDWPDKNSLCPICKKPLILKENPKVSLSTEQIQEYQKRKKVWTYLLILSVFISLTSLAAQWRTSLVSSVLCICIIWDINDFKQKVSHQFKTNSWLILSIIGVIINVILTAYYVITLYF